MSNAAAGLGVDRSEESSHDRPQRVDHRYGGVAKQREMSCLRHEQISQVNAALLQLFDNMVGNDGRHAFSHPVTCAHQRHRHRDHTQGGRGGVIRNHREKVGSHRVFGDGEGLVRKVRNNVAESQFGQGSGCEFGWNHPGRTAVDQHQTWDKIGPVGCHPSGDMSTEGVADQTPEWFSALLEIGDDIEGVGCGAKRAVGTGCPATAKVEGIESQIWPE